MYARENWILRRTTAFFTSRCCLLDVCSAQCTCGILVIANSVSKHVGTAHGSNGHFPCRAVVHNLFRPRSTNRFLSSFGGQTSMTMYFMPNVKIYEDDVDCNAHSIT